LVSANGIVTDYVAIHCQSRRPYNLYCVGGDVKPCSINQSTTASANGQCDIWCSIPPPQSAAQGLQPEPVPVNFHLSTYFSKPIST